MVTMENMEKLFQKRWFKIIAVIILALISIELLMRLFYKEHLDRYTTKPLIYQPDSVIGFTYIPNTVFDKGNQQFALKEIKSTVDFRWYFIILSNDPEFTLHHCVRIVAI